MSRKAQSINIFEYLDYRSFLRDWHRQRKSAHRSFSLRAFSKVAGFQSPNFFKLVMDGSRGLTEDSFVKFAKGLELNKQETEFFYNLVFFTQADGVEKKDYYYKKLLQSRKFNQLKPIEKDHYEFYATWYHPIIRELITARDFDGTPGWLVQRIYPRITTEQAEKSLELLENIGFIRKTDDGRWHQENPIISTGAESTSHTLLKYHQNLLSLNRHLLEHVPSDQRDVSALTLGIHKERIPQLKKKIQEFRQEILKLVCNDDQAEDVVVLSMQMMPMTRLEREKK